MQQVHIDVSGVKTKVMTWGGSLEEVQKKSRTEDVILMITGNPGLTRFYTVFLQTLYEQVKWPIVIIGHAGHEPQIETLPLKGNEKLYSLQGQVDHKVNFVKQYLPEATRIHLIGHSVGCYIILKLLKDEMINKAIDRSYMLFPTIEYMSDTPNGKFMTGTVRHVVWLLVFLSWIYTILPSLLQNFLVYLFIKFQGIPKMHLKTIVSFINPRVLENVFFMAFEEMELVKERDNDAIRDNLKKLKFYYGTTDGWVPVNYCEKVRAEFPEADVELCERKFDHSFVLSTSREVGNMVAGWINKTK